MLFKALIITLFILVLLSLSVGLFSFLRGADKPSNRTVKALTWRIGLSIALFILLFIGFYSGWISPHVLGE